MKGDGDKFIAWVILNKILNWAWNIAIFKI